MTLSPIPREGNTTIETGPNKTLSATVSSVLQSYQEQQQYIVKRTLDDTKESMKRVSDATSKEISRYNQTTNDSLDKTIQRVGGIADDYIKRQKEYVGIIESASSSVEDTSKAFSRNFSPVRIGESYVKVYNNFVDNILIASKMMHQTWRTCLQTSNKSVQLVKDNSKELSKIAINVTKTAAGVTG